MRLLQLHPQLGTSVSPRSSSNLSKTFPCLRSASSPNPPPCRHCLVFLHSKYHVTSQLKFSWQLPTVYVITPLSYVVSSSNALHAPHLTLIPKLPFIFQPRHAPSPIPLDFCPHRLHCLKELLHSPLGDESLPIIQILIWVLGPPVKIFLQKSSLLKQPSSAPA